MHNIDTIATQRHYIDIIATEKRETWTMGTLGQLLCMTGPTMKKEQEPTPCKPSTLFFDKNIYDFKLLDIHV